MDVYDSLILILFFSISIGIGFWQGRKRDIESSKVSDDLNRSRNFFLGGKNIHWFVLTLSLVATETSTLTFLGIPAMSYKGDCSFLSLAVGFILGRIISAIFILPLYLKGDFFSIYEWIGITFGRKSQKTLSLLFCCIRILSDGVRLYATSIPLSYLLQDYFPSNWSYNEISIISLIILTSATIAYSAYGGFRAVVWTDFLQFIVYTSGAIIVLTLLFQEYGSIWNLTSNNLSSIKLPIEKLNIIHTVMRTDSGNLNPYYILFAILGGILLSLGSHGSDQMIVQRLLACKNLRESRYALILSGFLVFLQFSLFLMIGIYLYIKIPNSENPNRIFSEYIVNNLTSPLKGFILAGIFASSMSTLSSTLNSLTLTTEVDLGITTSVSKWLTHKNLTVIWGLFLLLASTLPFILDENYKSNIVELGLSFASLVFGSMVALLFLKFLIPVENLRSMENSFPIILFSSITLNFGIHFIYTPPFTLIVGIGILNFYLIFIIFRFIILNISKWKN